MVAILLLGAFPHAALAGNWGALDANHRCTANDEFSQCTTQDYFLKVMTEFLDTSNLRAAAADRLENTFDPIAGIRAETSTSFADDDVQMFDGNYNLNGTRAYGTCSAGATKGGVGIRMWCAPQYVYMNNGQYPTDFDSVNERLNIMCHEIGHTFGLRHATSLNHDDPSKTCMKIGPPFSYTILHAHDSQHLVVEY